MGKCVLVAGIPGSGKSTFCRWLEEEKGWLHLDVDELAVGRGSAERIALIGMLAGGDGARAFAEKVQEIDRSVVIDWGFPPDQLDVVEALKANGVELWWFDGDRATARLAFDEREGGRLEAAVRNLERQLGLIDARWQDVARVFERRLLQVVAPGPKYLTPETIMTMMCLAGARG